MSYDNWKNATAEDEEDERREQDMKEQLRIQRGIDEIDDERSWNF